MDLKLSVAVDSAAAFRRLGDGRQPSTVSVALLAEMAGTDWISYDLRSSDRTDSERDARLLRACLGGRLDLTVASGPDLLDLAFSIRPDRLTLAPERRDGAAIHGGVDAHMVTDSLKKRIVHLHDAGIKVGVRIEPELEQIKALHRCEADLGVVMCGAYARAKDGREAALELTRISDAVALAHRLSLKCAIAGPLDLIRVEALSGVTHLDEVQVGHSCMALSLLRGVDQAVQDFMQAIARGRRRSFNA
ncbi:MAG: pyridoxine 5'-phosphate synthase [Myxococcota bacterium]|nr:pyridoxine 5'-phosphate synthase [Myxococcota bacterium]